MRWTLIFRGTRMGVACGARGGARPPEEIKRYKLFNEFGNRASFIGRSDRGTAAAMGRVQIHTLSIDNVMRIGARRPFRNMWSVRVRPRNE